MVGKFTFTARTVPECEGFLKIQWPEEEYTTIDEFVTRHSAPSDAELDLCMLRYRGNEKTFKDYISEQVAFSEELQILSINSFKLIINPTIKAAWYYAGKTADCLQNARFFTIKSNRLLDSDDNIRWTYGYIPHFSMRCTYFGTASTWYSNTFDQLLQAVYWAYELYTDAVDRDGNPYDDSWNVKKIMTFCTYEFVVGTLKSRGLTSVRKLLTNCSGKIEEVRSWANYIKHKGGIEYKFLEPEDPIKIYIAPVGESPETGVWDERFAIKNFKSPIEIDIDEKMVELKKVHQALYECIEKTIDEIDFNKYLLNLGGEQNGKDANGVS